MKQRERTSFEAPLFDALGQQPDSAYKLLSQGPDAIDFKTPAPTPSVTPADGDL